MKYFILLLSCICMMMTSYAQISVGAVTSSTITTKVPGYSGITSINTKTFSYTPSVPTPKPTPIDEDSTTEDNGIFEFADIVPVNIANADGNITTTSAGVVWTLRISVPNAKSIGINFNQFLLTDSAKMFIFDQSRSILQGVIKKNLFPSQTYLNAPSINSNDIIIYVVESGNFGGFQSVLSINKLALGYEDIAGPGSNGAAIMLSGGPSIFDATINCIPSVMCYPQKMETARAVARMRIPRGSRIGQCTGTLLNNEQNNGRALFLTAFHCIDANDNKSLETEEINALSGASFDFQLWRTTCPTGNVNGDFLAFTGAVLRAQRQQSDMVLLELNNPPGVGDGVTYAGWNRNSGSPPNDKSFIIHHPRGEDMRYTPTRIVRNYLFNSNFWQAFYSTGVVDRGSSGSALFNGDNQVVGQLKGGWSSCNFTDFSDRYGKLERSYNSSTLQPWLSPAQNVASMNALVTNGMTIQGSNELGCTGTYSVPNLLGCTYQWTTSPNITINSGQSTNSIVITKTSVGTGWVNVLITDSKGSPNGRTLSIQRTLTLPAINITGTIIRTGFPDVPLYTDNDLNNDWALINLNAPGATSWSFVKFDGTPSASFTTSGLNTENSSLNVYFPFPGFLAFNVTASSACATLTREYYFWSGSFNFTVGPNPVKTILNITIEDMDAPTKSKIQDRQLKYTARLYEITTGNLVREKQNNDGNGRTAIDVRGLKQGQYILQVELGRQKISRHIIIE